MQIGLFFQVTIQSVISTDGVASFAAFIYSDNTIHFHSDSNNIAMGFDAGDQAVAANINIGQDGVSAFRIDGEIELYCI